MIFMVDGLRNLIRLAEMQPQITARRFVVASLRASGCKITEENCGKYKVSVLIGNQSISSVFSGTQLFDSFLPNHTWKRSALNAKMR